MPTTTERAIGALELLPEKMREPAVAYLIEQAEKIRALKATIQEGIDDAEAGLVEKWDFEAFLKEARQTRLAEDTQ